MKKIFIVLALTSIAILYFSKETLLTIFIQKQVQEYLKGSKVTLENVRLGLFNGIKINGKIYIDKISYKKTTVGDIEFLFEVNRHDVLVNDAKGNIWKGTFIGKAKMKLSKEGAYIAELNLKDLDVDNMIKDLDLGEKFDLSGRLNGTLTVGGSGPVIKVLDGELTAALPGGDMFIKDRAMLSDIAKRAKQDENLIVETFQKYHYNKGTAKVGIENNNLMTRIFLEGESGKRDLEVVLHEFNRKPLAAYAK